MKVKRISAREYLQISHREGSVILDLRTSAEHAKENLSDSILLPVQELDCEKFKNIVAAKNAGKDTVYLLCQSGKRAEMAVEKLKDLGDCKLVIIEGGLNALKQAGVTVNCGGNI